MTSYKVSTSNSTSKSLLRINPSGKNNPLNCNKNSMYSSFPGNSHSQKNRTMFSYDIFLPITFLLVVLSINELFSITISFVFFSVRSSQYLTPLYVIISDGFRFEQVAFPLNLCQDRNTLKRGAHTQGQLGADAFKVTVGGGRRRHRRIIYNGSTGKLR